MIKAVIFDMDGVLVDSEYAMRKAAILALEEWGVTAQHQDFKPFVGAGEDRFIGGVAQLHGKEYQVAMKHRAYEIYLEICHRDVTCFPGIPQTFQALKDMGLVIAIASAADAIKVNANIQVAGIDPRHLDALVTGDDVTRKKPDPAAFLLAANRLGVDPSQCAVVEDAVNGIQAALSAGMAAIGIPSYFTPEVLTQSGAHAVAHETRQVPDVIQALNSHHDI